jgi:hypothetical protein
LLVEVSRISNNPILSDEVVSAVVVATEMVHCYLRSAEYQTIQYCQTKWYPQSLLLQRWFIVSLGKQNIKQSNTVRRSGISSRCCYRDGSLLVEVSRISNNPILSDEVVSAVVVATEMVHCYLRSAEYQTIQYCQTKWYQQSLLLQRWFIVS